MLRESNRAALIERTVTHAIRSPKHTAAINYACLKKLVIEVFGVRTLGHSMKIS